MITGAILGAAVGTGLALVITLTVVIYRYYVSRKRNDAWDAWERRLTSTVRDSRLSSVATDCHGIERKKSAATKGSTSLLHLPLSSQEIMAGSAEEAVQPPIPRLSPFVSKQQRSQKFLCSPENPEIRTNIPSCQHIAQSDMSTPLLAHQTSVITYNIQHLYSEGRSMPNALGFNADHGETSVRSRSPQRFGGMNSIYSSHSTVSSIVGSTTSLTTVGSTLSNSSTRTSIGALQPELYKQETTIVLGSSPQDSRGASLEYRSPDGKTGKRDTELAIGRLHFRLYYDFDKSDLVVHLIDIRDLALEDSSGLQSESEGLWHSLDCYIDLSLLPKVDHKRRHCPLRRQEEIGLLDECFRFPIAYDHLYDKALQLQLCEVDRYSRPGVLGELKLSLENYEITSAVNIWGDITKIVKSEDDQPQILLSLSYLPSAERLTVVVLKAKNLSIPMDQQTIDPFVKASLLMNGKRLKKKKTAVQKSTVKPVWNEALVFTLPATKLQNCDLEIRVLDHNGERSSRTSHLGRIVLGPEQTKAERQHWQEMSQYVRRSVAMWHILR